MSLSRPQTTISKAAGVAVSPVGGTVYVANSGDGTVSVIATATQSVTATTTPSQKAASLASRSRPTVLG